MENNIKIKKMSDKTVFYITGDVTSETEHHLLASYDTLNENENKCLVLNLQGSEYINSAGIAALIALLNEVTEKSGKLSISNLNSHFTKVIETVGLNDFVAIVADESEAFSSDQ